MQPHVSDSALSKILNRVWAGNLLEDNREPNIHGGQYKLCPICWVQGMLVSLNEVHVLISCPAVALERGAAGQQQYIQIRLVPTSSAEVVLCLYFGGNALIGLQCRN